MTVKKCDLCGERMEISKFARKELREKKTIKMPLGSIDIKEDWKNQKLKKLEQTNAGFKRKSRICKDCQKELGLKKGDWRWKNQN